MNKAAIAFATERLVVSGFFTRLGLTGQRLGPDWGKASFSHKLFAIDVFSQQPDTRGYSDGISGNRELDSRRGP